MHVNSVCYTQFSSYAWHESHGCIYIVTPRVKADNLFSDWLGGGFLSSVTLIGQDFSFKISAGGAEYVCF